VQFAALKPSNPEKNLELAFSRAAEVGLALTFIIDYHLILNS
jgi:hypothetical protein